MICYTNPVKTRVFENQDKKTSQKNVEKDKKIIDSYPRFGYNFLIKKIKKPPLI